MPFTGDVDLPNYGDSLVPDATARAQLVATMLVPQPTPLASPDAIALASIPPSKLRVDVENGSGVAGAARKVAAVLQHAGFTIGEVGDAERSDYNATEIHQHSNVTFAGAKVRESLPPSLRHAAVVPDPAASASPAATDTPASDVTVIIGSDVIKSASAGLPDQF